MQVALEAGMMSVPLCEQMDRCRCCSMLLEMLIRRLTRERASPTVGVQLTDSGGRNDVGGDAMRSLGGGGGVGRRRLHKAKAEATELVDC